MRGQAGPDQVISAVGGKPGRTVTRPFAYNVRANRAWAVRIGPDRTLAVLGFIISVLRFERPADQLKSIDIFMQN